MRPLFTIHAGEFLVGEFIEQTFPALDVWVPTKDTGIDLLVTGKRGRRPVSLQVKLSRDYRPAEASTNLERIMVAKGWLTIFRKKLASSTADFWVIVLVSHERKMKPRFVVIPPQKLLNHMIAIHGTSERYDFYPWITKDDICLNGRGLTPTNKRDLVERSIVPSNRDLTSFLEKWTVLEHLARND